MAKDKKGQKASNPKEKKGTNAKKEIAKGKDKKGKK